MREVRQLLEVGREPDGRADLPAREVEEEEVRQEEVRRRLEAVLGEGEGPADHELGLDAEDDAFVHQDGWENGRTRASQTSVREETRQEGAGLTERVEVQRHRHTLLYPLVCPLLLVCSTPCTPRACRGRCHPIDRERVEPDAQRLAVVAPERVLERANAREMRPVGFDPVGQDL